MTIGSIKRFVRVCLVAQCMLMSANAIAEPLKLNVDVTEGNRAIIMNNYLTATLAVNLQPGQTIATADVTITNPASINGEPNTTNAENILISGVPPQTNPGLDLVTGELANWPGSETIVIYTPQPYNPPPNSCTPVLAPGASCYIRFSSDPGSPTGNQFLQIKGDNTQTIGVLLTVS